MARWAAASARRPFARERFSTATAAEVRSGQIWAAAGSEASQDEIFGPVVTIETFESEDEAISRANEVPYGLAA